MFRHLPIYTILLLIGSAPLVVAQPAPSTEGRTGTVRQPITAATPVDVATQKQLGLININGCSGTLLNRFWVLTARHCVQQNGQLAVNPPTLIPALLQPNQVTLTATWAPGRTGVASRLVELGAPNLRDIILVYFGRADLGEAVSQRLYLVQRQVPPFINQWVGRQLGTTDTVAQYGRGLQSFATVAPNGTVTLGAGGGPYGSANFNPTAITGTGYQLAITAGQVGHAGDSGGPTVVMDRGTNVGVAGVQSSCFPTGYAPGAPPNPPWPWATGISSCLYVSVQPVVQQIGRAIKEDPYCQPVPGCLLAPIINFILKP